MSAFTESLNHGNTQVLLTNDRQLIDACSQGGAIFKTSQFFLRSVDSICGCINYAAASHTIAGRLPER